MVRKELEMRLAELALRSPGRSGRASEPGRRPEREVVRDQLDDLGIIVDDQDSPLVSNGHTFSQPWPARSGNWTDGAGRTPDVRLTSGRAWEQSAESMKVPVASVSRRPPR